MGRSDGLYLTGGPEMIAAVDGPRVIIALSCEGGAIAPPPVWRKRQTRKAKNDMLIFPTDLLRTLVAVHRHAQLRQSGADAAGVTQPAVSTPIKRLQSLLGYAILR